VTTAHHHKDTSWFDMYMPCHTLKLAIALMMHWWSFFGTLQTRLAFAY
jgi:hypothetical protein